MQAVCKGELTGFDYRKVNKIWRMLSKAIDDTLFIIIMKKNKSKKNF